MLSLLERETEGERDALWSVHSPNIYDALSVMYAVQHADQDITSSLSPTPTSRSTTPDPRSGTPDPRSASPIPPLQTQTQTLTQTQFQTPSVPTPNITKERSSGLSQSCCGRTMHTVVSAMHSVRRQCYHILLMRMREVVTTATQFVLTQIVLPFLVVLGVVVGCRDIRYPKVELSSKNTDGIGEVCVGLGPKTPTTRHHTPFSSPYGTPKTKGSVAGSMELEPDRIAMYSGSKVYKMLLRIWRDLMRYLWSSPSKHRDDGDDDEDRETPSPSLSNSSTTDNGDINIAAAHKHAVNGSTAKSKSSHKIKIIKGRNVTRDDLKASRQFSGYNTLLSLLGTSSAYLIFSPLHCNHSRYHVFFFHFFFVFSFFHFFYFFFYLIFSS